MTRSLQADPLPKQRSTLSSRTKLLSDSKRSSLFTMVFPLSRTKFYTASQSVHATRCTNAIGEFVGGQRVPHGWMGQTTNPALGRARFDQPARRRVIVGPLFEDFLGPEIPTHDRAFFGDVCDAKEDVLRVCFEILFTNIKENV